MTVVETTLHITHDNIRYAVGERIECSEDQAKALIAAGAAKKAVQAETPEPEAKVEEPVETKAPETKAPEVKDAGAAKKAVQAETPEPEAKVEEPVETKAPETKAPEVKDAGAAKKAVQAK